VALVRQVFRRLVSEHENHKSQKRFKMSFNFAPTHIKFIFKTILKLSTSKTINFFNFSNQKYCNLAYCNREQ